MNYFAGAHFQVGILLNGFIRCNTILFFFFLIFGGIRGGLLLIIQLFSVRTVTKYVFPDIWSSEKHSDILDL